MWICDLEKLMKLRKDEVEKKASNAWMWVDKRRAYPFFSKSPFPF